MTLKNAAAAFTSVLALAACGNQSPTTPPDQGEVVPNVAGVYSNDAMWLTQFNRVYDGYRGSWTCSGSLTLVQAPGTPSFTGFAVVGAPCSALSFELGGAVRPGGAVYFTTGGPKPEAGPCVSTMPLTTYVGTLTENNRTLSVRSTKRLFCQGEGDYEFTQIITAYKRF